MIGCLPEEALMVGDSWEMDIVPAAEVGLHTFWLPGGEKDRSFGALAYPSACGTLEDLYALMQNGWLKELTIRVCE